MDPKNRATPDSARNRKIHRLLAASAPAQGAVIEIGSSAGYSTLWLRCLPRQRRRMTTFEYSPEKADGAGDFSKCGLKRQ